MSKAATLDALRRKLDNPKPAFSHAIQAALVLVETADPEPGEGPLGDDERVGPLTRIRCYWQGVLSPAGGTQLCLPRGGPPMRLVIVADHWLSLSGYAHLEPGDLLYVQGREELAVAQGAVYIARARTAKQANARYWKLAELLGPAPLYEHALAATLERIK